MFQYHMLLDMYIIDLLIFLFFYFFSIPNNIGTVTYETVRWFRFPVFLKKRRTLFKKKTNLVDFLTNHGKIQELCSSEAPVVRSRLR